MSEQREDSARTEDRRIEQAQEMEMRFYREQMVGLLQFLTKLRVEEAEVVIQRVWLRFFEHPPVFAREDTTEQPGRWFRKVARNEVANMIRERNRLLTQPLDVMRTDVRDRREEESALQAERERRLNWLRDALEKLRLHRADDYQLLVGRYFDQCSVKELAKREGLTCHAVSDRLNRIRDKLRELAAKFREESMDSP